MNVASACGKVILVGEHAVVYGRPAIALAVEPGATAAVRPARTARSTARVHDHRGVILTSTERFERALAAALAVAERRDPVDVELRLAIPPGGGLGASAAMGVALARALDPSAEVEALFRCAMAWETVFHGSPSGVDVAASLFGGCIRFQRGEHTRRIEHDRPVAICAGHSGATADTGAVVARVAHLRGAAPELVEGAFDRLGGLADVTEAALARGDVAELGRAFDGAHRVLERLHLSTPAIDAMCAIARRAGATGAKLSGAGSGGAVIAASYDDAAPRVLAAWRSAGFDGRLIEAARPRPPGAPPLRLRARDLHEEQP